MDKPRYIVEAESLLGEKEIKGKLANSKIKELFSDAGHPEVVSDEVPWCAAFVGACLARANQPYTGTLLARDYVSNKYKDEFDVSKKPTKYSIGVMTRGNSTWEGHVGFVMDYDNDFVWMLGGNQSNSVSVQKFPRKKFLGFVVPKDKAQDKTTYAMLGDSRRLSFQTWMERIYVAGASALGAIWAMWRDLLEIAQQNMGWALLGLLGFGWASLKVIKWMSVREYREGRYLPKKQWD